MSKFIQDVTIALLIFALIVVPLEWSKIAYKSESKSDMGGISACSDRATYMFSSDSDTWVRVDGIDIKRIRSAGKCYAVGTGKVYDVVLATIDGKPVRILE